MPITRYAVTIRKCHSHQLACHLRSPVTATPIIASARSTKQAITAIGSSLRLWLKRPQYRAALAA